jgi:hypothetical protein
MNPRKSVAAPVRCKKKTGLVGPASCSVELRCGYITARRMLAPKVPPALLGQICSDATPRVSRKIGIAWNVIPEANTLPIIAITYYAMKSDITH